jgi:hypothetical protein
MALRPRLSPGVPFRLSLRVHNITKRGTSRSIFFTNSFQSGLPSLLLAHSTFERSLGLPAGVVAAQAKAEFENGNLSITLPKPEGLKRKGVWYEAEPAGWRATTGGSSQSSWEALSPVARHQLQRLPDQIAGTDGLDFPVNLKTTRISGYLCTAGTLSSPRIYRPGWLRFWPFAAP